jgi:tetratricopeptide (TPR) repeat protein
VKRGVLALLMAMSLVTSTAYADPTTDDEGARAAMRRGVAAFGRGDAEQALAEYEAAKRLVPHANAPYLYAAEALVVLERYPEAVENLERYLAKNPGVSDGDDVRGRIARIKAQHFPGRLRIVANSADAVVLVDGEPRGSVRQLELKPGKHRVELRATAHEPLTQEIDVVGDREATLVFTFADERTGESPVMVPPQPTFPHTVASPWRTVGWVVTGAGATALVVSFIVDAAALGPKIADYRAAADRRDPAARTLHDDVGSLRGDIIAGYVTGGILTAAGLGIVLFGPRTTTVAVTPWATPTAAGLGFRAAL